MVYLLLIRPLRPKKHSLSVLYKFNFKVLIMQHKNNIFLAMDFDKTAHLNKYKIIVTKSMSWSGSSQEKLTSVSDCANACKGNASMIVFGTNEFGSKHCDEDGCSCYCKTDKNCDVVSHNGYRLYTFIGSSKYFFRICAK